MCIQLVYVVISLILSFSDGKLFDLEVEDFVGETDPSIMKLSQRPSASGTGGVWMVEGAQIIMEFCLSKESDFSVTDVKVSNDGAVDSVSIMLDWDEIATFETFEKSMGGKGWDNYKFTGPVGIVNRVPAGRHSLILNVTSSDSYGVEIDKVQLFVNDEDLGYDVFRCEVFCFDEISYKHVSGRDFIASARAEQKSFKSTCAEVDNVKIPFYHRTAKKFVLKASHPKYKAFVNIRRPDFTDCDMALENLWRFENFTFSNDKKLKVNVKNAVLAKDKTESNDTIVVFFNLRGPKRGSTDSEIGSILTFSITDKLTEPLDIGIQYFGRKEKWSAPTFKTFTPESLRHEMRIPDYTWTEGPKNVLRFVLPLNTNRTLEFESVTLRKRPVTNDLAFKLFDNGNLVVEGSDVDFWWQHGKKMKVKILDTGLEYDNADYIKFYERIPWSESNVAQTFVIYQDGTVRLLPISPPGVDWIPFGSSVLIGESNPFIRRPSAHIDHMDIDLKKLLIKLYYDNNNTATLQLRSSFAETSLTVSDLNFKDRNRWPFLTFMSMWVADGNADVDHISVNGNSARGIISDWKKLYGTSFAFYRKCLSKHNTLSPDIQIEILEP